MTKNTASEAYPRVEHLGRPENIRPDTKYKHSSLLQTFVNYWRKKFYNIWAMMAFLYNWFFIRHLTKRPSKLERLFLASFFTA